ncbi:MAG: hypothetical protein LBC90_05915 [Candidatus Adiutrix sp.]|jgi:hypothetical protein|nr:hypothetical protein [Candidatus Adiutrix sp.]
MPKKILFLALTAVFMAGCHSTGHARPHAHHAGAAPVRSVYYAPAPAVVHRPAPLAYRPAPPPPVNRFYSPGPPPPKGPVHYRR